MPCYDERADIKACVESVLAQDVPDGGFEVIVADGMSDDGTRGLLRVMQRQDARLRVIDNEARTAPHGMNSGIREAVGEYIAIIGAHSRYAPDYLVSCLSVALRTGADNVGGAPMAKGIKRTQRAIAASHHSRFSVGPARWHNTDYEGPTDTVFGGFYKREVFDQIGLFDEDLIRNQDDELNRRLTKNGGLIWQSPDIKSWYTPRSSLRGLFRQYRQYGYWKVRVIQKHRLPSSWRHVVPAVFVVCITTGSALALMCGLLKLLGHTLPTPIPALVYVSLAAASASYVALDLAASIATAATHGWELAPTLAVVFPCYHLSYGAGFISGINDFCLRGRAATTRMVAVTR
jgi:glycosyltransferase involved in cell wall biosynthesis